MPSTQTDSDLEPEDKGATEARLAPPLCLFHGLLPLLLAAVADIALVWLWHIGAMPKLTVVTLHVLVAAVPLVSVHECGKEGLDERLAWMGALTVFFLGPMGAIGTFWAMLMYARYRRHATPFDEWYRTILPEQDVSKSESLVGRLRAWGQRDESRRDPVPFREILGAGSRKDKQLAIALMARNYNPAFGPAFKEALADEDNAVRVQAASAITHIEETYLQAALRLEAAVKRHPRSSSAWLALAEHYDSHANAGLSDTDMVETFRAKAEMAYREVLQRSPRNYPALWGFGRLMVRRGAFDEAVELFQKAFEQRPDQPAMQRIWYWEALFRCGRYAQLRTEVKTHFGSIADNSSIPPALLDSLALWSGEADLDVDLR